MIKEVYFMTNPLTALTLLASSTPNPFPAVLARTFDVK